MSAERCPDCDAAGVDCGCAAGAGFEPLRIRPYLTLPDPGLRVSGSAEPPQPTQAYAHAGVAGSEDATPAYGMPAVWPDTPPQASWPAGTAPLHTEPHDLGELGVLTGADPARGRGSGRRSAAPSRRRRLPTVLAGAGTVLAVGTVALTLGMLSHSGESDTVLLDAKPSAEAVDVAPAGPTQPPTSAAPSRSAAPTASRSASKSASPSSTASRSAAPQAAGPSPSASRPASSPPPPPKTPTLRYGDSGPEVEKMQRLLAAQGWYRGKINGRYDDRTARSVDDFQDAHDIWGEWGEYGPQTRKALEGTG
ncbi:peptidoglycan-binding domain-containing protein [Streptomyces sp. NPDC046876]|uniref:peptidoglycan-binding domain-containing protein n=1 Tax=Streptomyces sp. NPDC046876 TaxID=3155616 RepID=UPI0033EEBD40